MKKSFYEARTINNFKELLNSSARLYGEKNAYKLKGKDNAGKPIYQDITYTQFKNHVDSLGTAFVKHGLSGKKISVISDNCYDWAVSYFAVTNGTGIVVPLDRALPEIEIANLIKRAGVSAVVFSEKYRDIMHKIAKENDTLELLVEMDFEPGQSANSAPADLVKKEKDANGHYHTTGFTNMLSIGSAALKSGDRSFVNAQIDSDALGIILFTSGTTKMSKGVMLSQKNIASSVMAGSQIMKVYTDDVFLSFLPLHHIFECMGGFLMPLFSGACIVFCEGVRHIANNMKEYKISCMVCVPLLFEAMHKKMSAKIAESGKADKLKKAIKVNNFLKKFLRIDLSRKLFKNIHDGLGGNVRLMISGGAPIDPMVCQSFQDLGVRLSEGYGLTETAVISVNNDRYVRNGSVGIPLPNMQVEIDNPDTDGIGEIKVKSSSILLGYYEMEEETKEVLVDGWFYTGDLGRFDKDGFLYITGRKKDMIVMKSGKKVFPEEIEILLNKSDYVAESFVYGKPMDGDHRICTKIVYNKEVITEKFGEAYKEDQVEQLIRDVVKDVNSQMPSYKVIKEISVTDEELIKTTTLKIKRKEEMKRISQ